MDLETAGIERSMSEIKRSFRGLNSSIKTNMNNMRYGEKSVENYEKAVSSLNTDIEKQRKNLDDLGKKYAEAAKDGNENSKQAQNLANEYNKQADNLNRLEQQLENATDELKRMREEQRLAESGWGRLGKTFDAVGNQLKDIGRGMQDVGKNMSMYVTAPLVGVGAIATKTGVDFDDSMRKVQAVSGSTGEELIDLREKAKEMGATTRFSASESAEALNYMALAGWDTEKMLNGLDGIMNLAAASGEDLALVSDIVTDSISAFGMEAKDSARFADVLAQTSSNANTNVAGLGKAFEYVAPVAGSLGFTVEDTAKAIGLMSNNSIKGEKAGTALRTMMTNLAKPTGAMEEEMKRLGISLTDSEGNMKTFDEIMQDLRKSFSGLSEQQQASAAATIFGKEAMSGALAIINTTEEDYNNLSEAIGNSNGAAERMSEIMEGGLGGTLREIKSGLEGFAITLFEDMEPALQKTADGFKSVIDWLNNLSPQLRVGITIFAAFAAAMGPILTVGGMLISLFGSVMTTLSPLMTAIGKAGGLSKFLSKGIGILAKRFSFLLGPVGIAIGVITTLATVFTTAYKKSETFRNIVHAIGQKFVDLYHKIVEFLTTNPQILAFIDGVKEGFQTLKEKVSEAIQAVVDFFQDKIAELKAFWDENGAQFMEAVGNVFGWIREYIGLVMNWWTSIFQTVFPILQKIVSTAFNVMLGVIKTVWENIKGVISGGLNIIQGLIKTFSGLFTGDFSKMWEGIKQIFKGAIKLIWNWIQLSFIGRIIKGIGAFVKTFTSFIKNLWTGVKNIFSTVIKWIVDFVKKSFTTLKKNVTTIFNAVKKFISNVWNAIYGFFKTIIKSIVDFVKNRFNNLKTNITNIFNSIKNTVKSIWNGIKDNIINPITNAVKTGLNKFGEFKRKVTDTFKNIKNSVSDYVSDMVQKVKDMPGKMKDGIVKGAGAVKEGMLSVARKMVDGLASGVNGVISGIDWVLGKLKAPTLDYEFKPSKAFSWYAKGTGGHPGGHAVLGDGTGDNSGSELTLLPNGKAFMSADKPTLYPDLPKGTQVISAKNTRKLFDSIPMYNSGKGRLNSAISKGKDIFNWGKEKVTSAVSKVKDWTGNVFDYIKEPGKLLDIAIDKLGIKIPDIGVIGDIAKGGFKYVKDKAVGFIKDKMENLFGGGDIPNVAGSGVQRWAGVARQALMMTNQYTEANLKRLLYQMKTESGGNPKAINLWDINAKRGTPSKGLMQVIDPTFAAHKMPGFNNIWNPLDNILASIRYAVSRYGSLAAAYRGVGYKTGGLVNMPGLYHLAEEGWPEWVIPTAPNRRTDAMKLLALAAKDIQGNKRPSQLPNVSASNDNKYLEQIIDKLSEQVADTKEIVSLLARLLLKNTNIELDGRLVGQLVEKYVTNQQKRKNKRKRRGLNGV